MTAFFLGRSDSESNHRFSNPPHFPPSTSKPTRRKSTPSKRTTPPIPPPRRSSLHYSLAYTERRYSDRHSSGSKLSSHKSLSKRPAASSSSRASSILTQSDASTQTGGHHFKVIISERITESPVQSPSVHHESRVSSSIEIKPPSRSSSSKEASRSSSPSKPSSRLSSHKEAARSRSPSKTRAHSSSSKAPLSSPPPPETPVYDWYGDLGSPSTPTPKKHSKRPSLTLAIEPSPYNDVYAFRADSPKPVIMSSPTKQSFPETSGKHLPMPGLSGRPNGPVGNLLKGPIDDSGKLKDAALMVGIKLDLEAEVHLTARVRGDILVGLY